MWATLLEEFVLQVLVATMRVSWHFKPLGHEPPDEIGPPWFMWATSLEEKDPYQLITLSRSLNVINIFSLSLYIYYIYIYVQLGHIKHRGSDCWLLLFLPNSFSFGAYLFAKTNSFEASLQMGCGATFQQHWSLRIYHHVSFSSWWNIFMAWPKISFRCTVILSGSASKHGYDKHEKHR